MTTVVILTRFSLINHRISHSWKSSRVTGTDNDYIRRILDPDRLSTRCKLFVDFSIPCLQDAVLRFPEISIKLLVHYSSLLPDSVTSVLTSAAKNHDWIYLKSVHPDDAYNLTGEISDVLSNATESPKDGVSIVPMMRLDDDDLLSPDYFSLLSKYIDPRFMGMTIHAPRGFEGLFDGEKFVCFSPLDAPKTGIGLAHLAGWDNAKNRLVTKYTLPPGKHKDTDLLAPVILDGSIPVIFRTKHLHNDARATVDGYHYSIDGLRSRFFKNEAEISTLLRHFPIFNEKL